ncbi:MAG: hypothetical protein LR015_05450 [Verrucomicrobia bacterium]|nr:hypothetical protein [Verrucomicrobiota bacterium]
MPRAVLVDGFVRLPAIDLSISVGEILWTSGDLVVSGMRTDSWISDIVRVEQARADAGLLLRGDEFRLVVDATGRVITEHLDEQIEVAVEGGWDANSFAFNRLTLQWPGMDARLDQPLRGSLETWQFESPATFFAGNTIAAMGRKFRQRRFKDHDLLARLDRHRF